MGLQLHETVYWKNFFEYQLPKLTEAIENLSENIKRQKDSEGTEKEDLAPEKREALLAVLQNPQKAEAFGRRITEQVETDDESPEKIGYYAAKAILDGSMDDLLIAICGWSVSSLLDSVNSDIWVL